MKFSLVALTLAVSSVLARPLDERTLEERQGGIVYLQEKSGNIQPRLEVRTLKDTQPNQYTLLIVALHRWQTTSQSLNTGYFQTAAIHGVPRANYNNVGQCGSCGGTDGYAVHDSILFPSWHRAYVGQFEQQFLAVVKQVAAEYPAAQRQTMQAAANKMRWPYYDAAAIPKQGMPAFPKLMSEYQVTVNGPSGKTTLVNPLFRYHINDPSGFVYSGFTTWHNTLRYPNSNAANAMSNEQSTVNAFQNIRQSLADSFYNLFSNCHDWLHFSNDHAGSSIPSCAGSMEDVHNTIHTAIGGSGSNGISGGHMYYLPVSSFDPSFWLHHANIDRMTAFWQTLNPNQWAASQNTPTASWTLAYGQPVNEGSALTPFRRTSGGNNGFWTPNGVRNWHNLGYTYPEYSNSDGSAAAISSAINRLYGPNAGVGVQKRDLVSSVLGSADSTVNNTADSTVSSAASAVSSMASSVSSSAASVVSSAASTVSSAAAALSSAVGSSPLVAPNGTVFQYVANIYTPRYLLDGSYQVYLFNTAPASETDTSSWITDSNLIGLMGVLSKPGMTNNKLLASGSIPLTRTLQSMAGTSALTDLSEAVVVPYLMKNLQWRIAGPDSQPLDPSTVPGFVLSVFASTASQPASDAELPSWSPFISLVDVTKDQAGGANSTTQATVPVAESALSAVNNLLSAVSG